MCACTIVDFEISAQMANPYSNQYTTIRHILWHVSTENFDASPCPPPIPGAVFSTNVIIAAAAAMEMRTYSDCFSPLLTIYNIIQY